MSWNSEQVDILIDEIKAFPCLYNFKSKQYKNRYLRNKSIERIKKKLERVRPGVTAADIKSKFARLKKTFFTELAKVEDSCKINRGTTAIYEPTLWYIKKLMFLREYARIGQPTNSIECAYVLPSQSVGINDNLLIDVKETNISHITEENGLEGNDVDGNLMFVSTTETIANEPIEKRIKRETTSDLSKNAPSASATSSNTVKGTVSSTATSAEQVLADFIVSRLQQIEDQKLRKETEHKMVQVLFQAEMETINN